MREPPPHVTDEDVLATVAEHWAGDLDRIGHLPVGFGAYHWRAERAGHDPLRHPRPARRASHDRDARRGVRRSRRAVHLGSRLRPGPARDARAAYTRCRSRDDALSDDAVADRHHHRRRHHVRRAGARNPRRPRPPARDQPARRDPPLATTRRTRPRRRPRRSARPAPGTPARTARTPAPRSRTTSTTSHVDGDVPPAGGHQPTPSHLGRDPRRAAHPQPAARPPRRCS